MMKKPLHDVSPINRKELGRDPLTGAIEYFSYDPTTDGMILETVVNVAPMLERNLIEQNNAPSRWGEWTRVASLDPVTIMQLSEAGILAPGGAYILDQKRMTQWLNDRDTRKFRTRLGRV